VSGVRDEAELEWFLRDWLAGFHMDPSDTECFILKVKASTGWHPQLLSFSLSEDDTARIVAACSIDVSNLWAVAGD